MHKLIFVVIITLFVSNSYSKSMPSVELSSSERKTKTENHPKNNKADANLVITFEEAELPFTEEQKYAVESIAKKANSSVRKLLPTLTQTIELKVSLVNRDLSEMGGVSGRAENANLVFIEISNEYAGGVIEAINAGLTSTIYHEFHHLVRGWTMQGNKFGPGISIASVNEGLAVVFAEEHTKILFKGNAYPKNVDQWIVEILNLPENAPYSYWMMESHTDGRSNIGYKAGKYIIERAVAVTGKSVIELTDLSPFELLDLSGLIESHSVSQAKLAEYYASQNQIDKAIETYQKAYEIEKTGNAKLAAEYSRKLNLLKNPIVISEKILANYVGTYQSNRFNFDISKNGKHLTAKMAGRPAFQLIPESQNLFFIREADVTFEFIMNDSSARTLLVFHANNQRFEIPKVQ